MYGIRCHIALPNSMSVQHSCSDVLQSSDLEGLLVSLAQVSFVASKTFNSH